MHHAQLFRRLLVAAVLVGSSAAVAADVAPLHLNGLDPAVYLKRRSRTPDVSAEVKALPVDTQLRLLADDDAIAWPAPLPGAALKPAEQQAWRQKERRAVKHAAITALSTSDDPRVEAALVAAIDDVDLAVGARAAERLGARPGREALLQGLATDTARPLDIRAGACAGLGHQRTAAAVDALVGVIAADGDAELRRSALAALELATSRWAFEARGDVAAGKALRARAVAALAGVTSDDVAATAARLRD